MNYYKNGRGILAPLLVRRFMGKSKAKELVYEILMLTKINWNPLAKTEEDKVQYIKNKAFNDKYYQDMIVNYLREFGKGNRAAMRELLIDKFPDTLSFSQKDRKVLTLLTALKRKGIITTDSENKKISNWILVSDNEKE